MTDRVSAKNKHLTDEMRREIQECLSHGMTFKAIAKRVGKDQTTISKEIKKHLVVRPSGCKRVNDDGTPVASAPCPKLLKTPFVCNPCSKYHGPCVYNKQVYIAKKAQDEYKTALSESRTGVALNRESFYSADAVIADAIKKGQRLYHILNTNKLGMSKSSVYRHLKRGYLSISALDFPRVPKFKPRARRKTAGIPKVSKQGRTHADFLTYIHDNDLKHWVEMDTVIGRIGGKTIMTLHFTDCNFMIGLLFENKTSAEVTRAVKSLKHRLFNAGFSFGAVFPVINTDNGGEFANVNAIEQDLQGSVESRLFFCDPYQSSQKPRIEKNHTLLRDIVPGGSSFDGFSQADVDKIFSHVNCVKRLSLKGKTAYEYFCFLYGSDLPAVLGIECIPPEAVCQSPKLLKM